MRCCIIAGFKFEEVSEVLNHIAHVYHPETVFHLFSGGPNLEKTVSNAKMIFNNIDIIFSERIKEEDLFGVSGCSLKVYKLKEVKKPEIIIQKK